MNLRSGLQSVVDWLIHSASRDPRVAIVLIVLAAGLFLWTIDRVLSLGLERVPLDERERAWLALAAPYFQVHLFRAGDLGGKTVLGLWRIRWLLRKDWLVRDAASARDKLDWLVQSGHRKDPRFRDPAQSAADLAIVDRALLAWDTMRLVFLARCCYAAGYIDVATTWTYVAAAARMARGGFASWTEWGRAFATGRAMWSGDARSYYTQLVEKLLREPRSVWSRTPWHLATQA
jgi:hypothetical protein